MGPITDRTNLYAIHGTYVLTDPAYYQLVLQMTNWKLPPTMYNKVYPASWRLVARSGSARLFYAP